MPVGMPNLHSSKRWIPWIPFTNHSFEVARFWREQLHTENTFTKSDAGCLHLLFRRLFIGLRRRKEQLGWSSRLQAKQGADLLWPSKIYSIDRVHHFDVRNSPRQHTIHLYPDGNTMNPRSTSLHATGSYSESRTNLTFFMLTQDSGPMFRAASEPTTCCPVCAWHETHFCSFWYIDITDLIGSISYYHISHEHLQTLKQHKTKTYAL